MKYTVLYKPEVIHHIDRIWRESDDQEMIAEEIDNLGRMLGHDPNNLGESREKMAAASRSPKTLA